MPTNTFTYPEPAEIKQVEQDVLPQLVEDDPIFEEFPMVESDRARLRWEQMDNYQGLQQVRGLNGLPRVVKMPGAKEYDAEPGVYGEFVPLSEKELTERRELGSWDTPVSIDDMVGFAQQLLLQRRIDRIRTIVWTLLSTGTFAVANGEGAILHSDTFTIQTLSALVNWSTFATSTPSLDLRAAQLLSLGHSVDFGAGARMYMNRVTANWLLSTTNAADIFGRRVNEGSTINSVRDVNAWSEANDLPQVVVYDKFYITDSGTATRFIPNGKVVIVGRRTNGANVGQYRLTRNFNNPRLEPGPYTRVVDTREYQVPGGIHVHDGHNGGPVLYFPSAVIVLTVG